MLGRADLGIIGKRERTLEGWIDQARNFYGSVAAKPALQAKLDPAGLTAVVLGAAASEVEAAEGARRARREEKEEAESATVSKLSALGLLDVFMGAFLKVARVVFEDEPQRLERLGITVP